MACVKSVLALSMITATLHAYENKDICCDLPKCPHVNWYEYCVTPTAHFPLCNDWGVYVSGEALFWKAAEDSLDYLAIFNENQTTTTIFGPLMTTTKDKIQFSLEAPDFKWDWGFRTQIGFIPPHDEWDVLLSWTHSFTTATRQLCQITSYQSALNT